MLSVCTLIVFLFKVKIYMPKRNDINSILLIGAGPIVIGQACEFDYSGAQACKALREEGFKIILVIVKWKPSIRHVV